MHLNQRQQVQVNRLQLAHQSQRQPVLANQQARVRQSVQVKVHQRLLRQVQVLLQPKTIRIPHIYQLLEMIKITIQEI